MDTFNLHKRIREGQRSLKIESGGWKLTTSAESKFKIGEGKRSQK